MTENQSKIGSLLCAVGIHRFKEKRGNLLAEETDWFGPVYSSYLECDRCGKEERVSKLEGRRG